MKALVFHGIGDIRLEENAPEPIIQKPTDAVVRLTVSSICGTDLHMIRGTMGMMEPGTIMGHEGVGIVEEIGSEVRNLNIGDRVIREFPGINIPKNRGYLQFPPFIKGGRGDF